MREDAKNPLTRGLPSDTIVMFERGPADASYFKSALTAGGNANTESSIGS